MNMEEKKLSRVGANAVTPDELGTLKSGIMRVWQAIGSDAEACCEQPMTNEEALETCVDADRLVTFGAADADDCLK